MKIKTGNNLIAFCAIYCGSCPQYLKINNQGKRFCNGCKSDKAGLKGYCKTCKIKNCCQEKKIRYCYQCLSYPCQKLVNHRNLKIGTVYRCYRHTLFERMKGLKKLGEYKFMKEIVDKNKLCINRNKLLNTCNHLKISLGEARKINNGV